MLLIGCTSNNQNRDDNKNDHSSNQTQEIQNTSKVSGKYFTVSENDYLEIISRQWKMCDPTTRGLYINRTVNNVFAFTTNDNKNVGCITASTSLLDRDVGIYDLQNTRKEFKGTRDNLIMEIEPVYSDVTYQDNYVETDLDGKKALIDKGIASVGGVDKFNYVVFSFFLEEEGQYPTELLVTSHDGVSLEDLEAIARELVSTIEPI